MLLFRGGIQDCIFNFPGYLLVEAGGKKTVDIDSLILKYLQDFPVLAEAALLVSAHSMAVTITTHLTTLVFYGYPAIVMLVSVFMTKGTKLVPKAGAIVTFGIFFNLHPDVLRLLLVPGHDFVPVVRCKIHFIGNGKFPVHHSAFLSMKRARALL